LAGLSFSAAADAYRTDILRAVEREVANSPVRPVRDGTYRSYLPSTAYLRGSQAGEALGEYSFIDIEQGALPLADAFGALAPDDDRIGSHLEIIEERLNVIKGDSWFFNGFAHQCKVSYVADVYLLRDDVPCFLRHLMNNYAGFVKKGGGFIEGFDPRRKEYEHSTPDSKPSGDSGSNGWFVKCFRNLLVMEQDGALWLARATPRAWLEQGKKIGVKNAPTHFGPAAYEIVSDADNGRINATVELPSRKAPKEVILRFRHPKAARQGQGNDHPRGPDRHGNRDGPVLTRLTRQAAVAASMSLDVQRRGIGIDATGEAIAPCPPACLRERRRRSSPRTRRS
jgi:hypothetical protein